MSRFARNFGFSSLGLAIAAAALTLFVARGESAPPTPGPTPITVGSTVPGELNVSGGGPATATLDQAAAFAWQEFIALSWPATAQTGAPNTRDMPASDCLFGGVPNPQASPPGTDCATRPLTWQTFRGKAEIFTNGATQTYDTLPTYADVYQILPNPPAPIPSCDGGPAPAQAAFVNLDETTQIFEDAMYAGAGPATATGNSQPRLIRFMAKANRAEFNYYNDLLNANGGLIPSALKQATIQFLRNTGNPPPGGLSLISLPNNTIEIKAAWRVLTPTEQSSGRFHTTTVRYYETNSAGATCYREGVWGLLALHIIQKTQLAPYFIYATFEQADNILTPGGQRVEDENGALRAAVSCPPGQSAPCPTTPALAFNDTATVDMDHVPPQVVRQPATAPYCQPQNRLYYHNLLPAALPAAGAICVNYRYNPIPAIIVAANQRAHAAIAAYMQANHIPSSPWLYYKLVNIQYVPLSNVNPGTYPGNTPTTSANRPSFYLANIVVETNRPLQMFSGSLVLGNPGTGSNSEYESQFTTGGTGTHFNVYNNRVAHNMGGCMGCHGAQGQAAGGDFSVILARGAVGPPEAVPPPPPPTARLRQPRR